ncbi:hypothetical protein GC170_11910 [bacterium]|nr:hypothetical protein [bacterium]
MKSIAIVLSCIFAAICYGILHDQITARVCVEYFTIGHPPVFVTDDPTLLGIGWGIIATWWVGFLLGVPLAIAALAGNQPARPLKSLIRPISKLLAVMSVCAITAGLMGWFLASRNIISLTGPIAEAVPADRHIPFLADLWAHNASYFTGFIGGIVVIGSVWRSRSRVAIGNSDG